MSTVEEPTPPAPTVVTAPPSSRPRGARRRTANTLLTLRVITSVHVVVTFGQSVFAGSYLSGDYDMLARHALGADVVTSLGYVQLAVAIVLWILGGPRWPAVATVLLVGAETGQYFAGMAGALDLHIPLGVAIMAGALLTGVTLWRPQVRGVQEASR